MDLKSKRVLTFDCYGTLIDWERGMLNAIKSNFAYQGIDDEKILNSFGYHETMVQQESPESLYPSVLCQTLEKMNSDFGISLSTQEIKTFGESVGEWPAFADTKEALEVLKKYFRLIIVSNIDNGSIKKSQSQMQFLFDEVHTAQDMRAYKPDRLVFEKLLSSLEAKDYKKSQVLHVAQSLYHDHVPAKMIGLDSVWIDRRHDKMGQGATPDVDAQFIPSLRFTSLLAFAEWCEDQFIN
jgi:2-haloacid dehalogenase